MKNGFIYEERKKKVREKMAEYTFGKDFAIRAEIDCIATEDVFGPYVGRITAVKIKTNADRIRSMTDEELADFITARHYTPLCPVPCCEENVENCENCWLEWLRKEVDDGCTN